MEAGNRGCLVEISRRGILAVVIILEVGVSMTMSSSLSEEGEGAAEAASDGVLPIFQLRAFIQVTPG